MILELDASIRPSCQSPFGGGSVDVAAAGPGLDEDVAFANLVAIDDGYALIWSR
ncbi:hypothetical protein [Mesorhizobium sp. M1378]|uniref:hypothetical protein n=1 Tax=Mesorhizobium sp. M1378 TaxID=2957092 RepID=UPI00333BD01B